MNKWGVVEKATTNGGAFIIGYIRMQLIALKLKWLLVGCRFWVNHQK